MKRTLRGISASFLTLLMITAMVGCGLKPPAETVEGKNVYIDNFYGGIAAFSYQGSYDVGFINQRGEILSEPIAEGLISFYDDEVRPISTELFWLNDCNSGELILFSPERGVLDFSLGEDVLGVSQPYNGAFWVWTKNGDSYTTTYYDTNCKKMFSIENAYCSVAKNEFKSYHDAEIRHHIGIENFVFPSHFNEKGFAVLCRDGKEFFVDTKGNTYEPVVIDRFQEAHTPTMYVERDGTVISRSQTNFSMIKTWELWDVDVDSDLALVKVKYNTENYKQDPETWYAKVHYLSTDEYIAKGHIMIELIARGSTPLIDFSEYEGNLLKYNGALLDYNFNSIRPSYGDAYSWLSLPSGERARITFRTFSENRIALKAWTQEGVQKPFYCIWDENGNVILAPTEDIALIEGPDPRYEPDDDGITEYNSGLICAKDVASGLWGYLDKEGNWAIAPQYTYARNFSDGLACVNGNAFIDPSGKVVFTYGDGSVQTD